MEIRAYLAVDGIKAISGLIAVFGGRLIHAYCLQLRRSILTHNPVVSG